MLLLLIDGLNLIRRIHAAVPAAAQGTQLDAEHDSGVLESCRASVQRALNGMTPSHAVCVFDGAGESWRHRLAPQYKANRPAMPDSLTRLLPRIEAAFLEMRVRAVQVPGFEADDVIAALAVKVAARGGEALILSTDKSMLSLLRPGIRVRNHFENRELDAEYVHDRFGVTPDALVTYLALVGDRSLGIPGVRSVGAKTASRLIGEHTTLDAILAAAGNMPGRIGEALCAGEDDARLSLTLSTLRTDIEVGINLKDCRLPHA